MLYRYSQQQQPIQGNSFSLPSTTKEKLKDILNGGNNKLGSGGFGTVRYGKLNGQAVAVKILDMHTQEGNIF